MAASVEFTGIEKRHGDNRTLRNISLSVGAGEFLTLVGPSGCGKSTLLRVVAGLTPHDAGTLRIGGVDVSHTPARDRNVAMVFQSYALYPHMSVAQNIATPLRMQRLSAAARLPVIGRFWPGSGPERKAIAAEVEKVAAQVQLTKLLGSRPSQLSGGQRQRVAVARAMVRRPGVFLMDEPLSNLDARLRVHMRAEISALHQRLGATFIYVTHDQVEAMTLSTRVAVMMDGEIVQVGTPRELYERPVDTRVARFIGSPEINLLPALLTEGEGLRLGDQRLPLRVDCAAGEVRIGWRPEILRLAGDAGHPQPGTVRLQARLERMEVLGHEALLICSHQSPERTGLTARVDLADIDRQRMRGEWPERLVLEADVADALVFDARGQRVECLEETVHALPIRRVM